MGEGATLVVVGGGNMGAALVQGLLANGRSAKELAVSEVNPQRRSELEAKFPGVLVVEQVPRCSEAIIAVKPNEVASACRAAVSAGATRVISIAAGVRLASLQAACGVDVRVVRAMPNTPATLGLAATAFTVGESGGAAERDWARNLLSSIGIVIEVEEPQLDAFTGFVGSGPAYVFYVAEALREAAIRQGFDAATSATLVARVLVGAAAMLERQPDAANELRRNVTSPNGTTAAGINELDAGRVADAFVAAVQAATNRSRELGAS